MQKYKRMTKKPNMSMDLRGEDSYIGKIHTKPSDIGLPMKKESKVKKIMIEGKMMAESAVRRMIQKKKK